MAFSRASVEHLPVDHAANLSPGPSLYETVFPQALREQFTLWADFAKRMCGMVVEWQVAKTTVKICAAVLAGALLFSFFRGMTFKLLDCIALIPSAIFAGLGKVAEVVGRVLGLFAKLIKKAPGFDEDETVEAQSGPVFMATIASIMAVAGPGSKLSVMERGLAAMKHIVPVAAGLSAGSDGLHWLLTKFPNTFSLYVATRLGYSQQDELSASYKKTVHDACVVLGEWVSPRDPGDFTLAAKTISVYKSMLSAKDYYATNKNSIMGASIEKVFADLTMRAQESSVILGSSKSRVAPVGIYFYGPTSIGKSTLVSSIAALLYPARETEDVVYSLNSTLKHWDSYRNQWGVLIDDYATTSGEDAKALNGMLLPLISTTAFVLPMAAIGDKGRTFTSSAVFMTSNRPPSNAIVGINNYEAFHTRFKYYEVSLKRAFADASGLKLDTAVLRAHLANNPDDAGLCPHLSFRLTEVIGSSTELRYSQPITFTELVRVIQKGIVDNTQNFKDVKAANNRVRARLVDEKVDFEIEDFPVQIPNPLTNRVVAQMDGDIYSSDDDKACEKNLVNRQMRKVADTFKEVAKSYIVPDSVEPDEKAIDFTEVCRKFLDVTRDYNLKPDMDLPDAVANPWVSIMTRVLSKAGLTDLHYYLTMTEMWKKCTAKDLDEVVNGYAKVLGTGVRQTGVVCTLFVSLQSVVPERRKTIATAILTDPEFVEICSQGSNYHNGINIGPFVGPDWKEKEADLFRTHKMRPKAYKGSPLSGVLQAFGFNRELSAFDITPLERNAFIAARASLQKLYNEPNNLDLYIMEALRALQPLHPDPESPVRMAMDRKEKGEEQVFDRVLLWLDKKGPDSLAEIFREDVCNNRTMKFIGAFKSAMKFVLPMVAVVGAFRFAARKIVAPESSVDRKRGNTNRDTSEFVNKRDRTREDAYVRSRDRVARDEDSWARVTDWHTGRYEPQAEDENLANRLSAIKANCLTASIRGSTLHCFCIGGCQVLFPRHFFSVRDEDGQVGLVPVDTPFILNRGSQRLQMSFDPRRVKAYRSEGEDIDLVVYDFSGYMQPMRDVTRHFATKEEHQRIGRCKATLVNSKMEMETNAYCTTQRTTYSLDSENVKELFVSDQWRYRALSKGDCGTILFSNSACKILSLHVASATSMLSGEGIGVRITQEAVVAALGAVNEVVMAQEGLDVKEVADELTTIPAADSVALVGELQRVTFRSDPKSEYKKLPYIEEEWAQPDAYLPSVIGKVHSSNPGHLTIDIQRDAMESFFKVVKPFPISEVEIAMEDVFDQFEYKQVERPPRALTDAECINGGLVCLGSIPMRTSEGYPWTQDRPKGVKGKKWMFSEDVPRVITHEPLRQALERHEDNLTRGVCPAFVWEPNLKSEMRPYDRVMGVGRDGKPKTRMIIASPVDATILFRKYFGDFISHVYAGFDVYETAVGMNVFSSDWEQMIRGLLCASDVGFDGDYSGMESYFTRQIALSLGDHIGAWYRRHNPSLEDGFEDKQRILLHSMVFSFLRYGRYVIMDSDHNKSGNILTTLINCIVVMLHFRLAWRHLARLHEPTMEPLEHFHRLVRLKVFGDDNICAVAERVSWFNPKAIGEYLSGFGVTFTPANKTAVTADLTPILGLTFLKMTTVRMSNFVKGQIYYPVVEEASLIKSLMWNGSKEMTQDQMMVALGNDVLSRVWSSGPLRFKGWRSRIQKAWARNGILESPLSFYDVARRWEARSIDAGLFGAEADYRLPYASVVRVSAQMEEAPTQALEVNEAALSVVQTSKEVATPSVVEKEENSIVVSLKRCQHVASIEESKGQVFPVAEIYLVNSIVMQQNLLCFFGSMYRCYMGELLFRFFCDPVASTSSISMAASPDSVLPKRGFGTLSTGNFGPMCLQEKMAEVVVANPQIYRFNVVPIDSIEAKADVSNYSNVAVNGSALYGQLFANVCDGFRLSCLYRVPRLRVVGNSYPRRVGIPFDIVEYIRFNQVDYERPFNETQNGLGSWLYGSVVPSTTIGLMVQMVVETKSMSNEQLRYYGFGIGPTQDRNLLPGTTLDVSVDFSGYRSCPSTWTISAHGPVGSFATNVWTYDTAVGSTTFVNDDGVQEVAADQFIVGWSNIGDNQFRLSADIPDDVILIRNGFNATLLPWVGPLRSDVAGPRWPVSTRPMWSLKVAPQSGFVSTGQAPVKAGTLTVPSGSISMGEDAPSNVEMVTRPQFVNTFVWASSHITGSIIGSIDVPLGLLNSRAMKSAWARNMFWRGNPQVMLNLQATQFVAGCVAVVWAPLLDSTQAAKVYGGDLISCMSTRHELMFPGKDVTVAFDIPYLHYLDALDTRKLSSQTLGTLLLVVVSPLRFGPSSTTEILSLTAYARFLDSEFSVINPRENVLVEAQGGIQSKVSNYSYNIEHVMDSSIDFKDSSADAFTGGETALSAPLDKPNLAINPMPVVVRTNPNLCNSVAVDYANRLDLESRPERYPERKDLATDVDEMSVRYLTSRYTPIGSFTVQTSDPVNSVLFKADLCPCARFFTAGVDDVINLDLMSYVSTPYSFWRGSLKYKIIVVGTALHAAKLMICSHVGFEASGLTVEEALGQYTTVLNIAGVTVLEVVFPWRSTTRFKRVCNGAYSDPTPFSMGQFSIRVLSPLQQMESIPSIIEVIVLQAAGDDYELHGLFNSAVDFRVEPLPE